ncbi:hypothetical protein LJC46_06880 [Desulfovibrio sp. OttesenSCG-928-G15]|nr:hypothetical protein [Desulfovibrio sp. OttesenSCG-928-G15]
MTNQIQFPESAIASLKNKAVLKKRKRWITLARHRRKNDVVRLRGRLSRSPETERLFWTDAYLPNDSRLPEDDRAKQPVSSWADIVFPSRIYNDILYNCEVLNFDAELIDHARECSLKEIPSPWKEERESRVVARGRWGKPLLYEVVKHEGEDEWLREVRARQKELLVAGMEVRESVTLDYDYKYGVGLYLVLNIPNLDLAGLKLAMERFFEAGEKEWRGEPVFHTISDYWLNFW